MINALHLSSALGYGSTVWGDFPLGAPHLGQECALLDISVPQSGQTTSFGLSEVEGGGVAASKSVGVNGFHSDPSQTQFP